MPGHELILHPAIGGRLSLAALAASTELHPGLVERFVEQGLLEPVIVEERALWFDAGAVRRLGTIRRLREDLGINLAGIAVVLELLERIELLRRGAAK
jgi:DNA-binding transcriptional MerR regulator